MQIWISPAQIEALTIAISNPNTLTFGGDTIVCLIILNILNILTYACLIVSVVIPLFSVFFKYFQILNVLYYSIAYYFFRF